MEIPNNRSHFQAWEEDYFMLITDNEKMLLELIHNNDNPLLALKTAIIMVQGFLKQRESFEEQAVADLRELS